MKKKLMIALMTLAMAVSVSACGESTEPQESGAEQDGTEQTGSHGTVKGLDWEQPKETTDTPNTHGETAGECTLGLEVDPDYDGFSYLYCETLMTESTENPETGKMESESLNVYIPKGDYISVNRDYARTDYLGVDFKVSLNPYFRYKQEDYLPEENLEYYVENEFDMFYYADMYKGVEISEIETVGDGLAVTVGYCYYDTWEHEYIPVYAVYYLEELADDLTVLVEVEISDDETTGKTAFLLEELEAFYGFDIDWSKEWAEEKLTAFLNSDEANKNMFSSNSLLFELPEGWETDYSWGDYTVDAFSPGGDYDFAGCVLTVQRDYVGSDAPDMSKVMSSEEEMEEYSSYFAEQMGGIVKDVTIENYGETPLGAAMKIGYSVEDSGYTIRTEAYILSYNGSLYTIMAIQTSDSTDDATAAAEMLLATVQTR